MHRVKIPLGSMQVQMELLVSMVHVDTHVHGDRERAASWISARRVAVEIPHQVQQSFASLTKELIVKTFL